VNITWEIFSILIGSKRDEEILLSTARTTPSVTVIPMAEDPSYGKAMSFQG